jgi:hypothetical protein
MLTGRRAFDGDDMVDVLGAVARLEPDWSRLPADVSPPLRALIQGCLAKDRRQRISDVSTALFVIQAPSLGMPGEPGGPLSRPRRPGWRRPLFLVPASIVIGTFAALAVWTMATAGKSVVAGRDAAVIAFDLPLPDGMRILGSSPIAVSADGSRIAIGLMSNTGERYELVRRLDSPEFKPMKIGKAAVGNIAWSPDARRIASLTPDGIFELDTESGTIEDLVTAGCSDVTNVAVIWPRSDRLLFTCGASSGIFEGDLHGATRKLTSPAGNDKDRFHSRPTILPDGSSLLFTRRALDRANDVAVIRDGNSHESVLPGHAHAVYSSGFLVFPRGNQLYAQRLDAATNTLIGEARSSVSPSFGRA